jgi:hypothetical protein
MRAHGLCARSRLAWPRRRGLLSAQQTRESQGSNEVNVTVSASHQNMGKQ